MKKFITLALVLAATYSNAQTIQDANDLYALRGEDANNAKLAADMYGKVAAAETDPSMKGKALSLQGLSLYFYGVRQSSSTAKEATHKLAFGKADEAIMYLSKEGGRFGDTPLSNTAEAKKLLAEAHYVSAINMGKWGEARGILASLGQWSDMKKHLEAVNKNDETVYDYGSYRTWGRAQMKLPFTHGGSKKKALVKLEKAYKATFSEDYETSVNPTTTRFYLDLLVDNKVKGARFCDAYIMFTELNDYDDVDLEDLNAELVPEFRFELKQLAEGKDQETDINGWAKSNCRL